MLKMIMAAAATLAALTAGALAFAPSDEIRTQVSIKASPQEVWAFLGDPQSHREWNPFLVNMEGEMIAGTRLVNTMRPSGGSEMTFRPLVLRAEPGEELRWLGRFMMPRLFDGEHYFLLEQRGEETLLVHGERFTGIALWFMDVAQFTSDFEAMNAALKSVVEARAASAGGDPLVDTNS
jgi:hypothetical protein